MALYQTVKGAVPLKWKVQFHEHKPLPKEMVARVRNRLRGRPPIPPGDLIHLVAGHRSAQSFLNGGRTASEAIRETLEKNGIEIEQFGHILDFGCGVGRIMRHWSAMRGPAWHGTDYNPKLVEWCRSKLKFAEFVVNPLSGRLPYEPETFDFIYAFSVFTHLEEPLQFHWIGELSRVLRPGGYLYFTTHGEYYFSMLSSDEQSQFRTGQLVVRGAGQSGSNICGTFHSAGYVQEKMARSLAVVDFIPSGAKGDSMHDVHLLRKPVRDAATPGQQR